VASCPSPHAALSRWVDLFVGFLVTKHGLAAALRSDDGFEALHAYFLERLVPVCAQLLSAAADAGEINSDVEAYELMRGIGNRSCRRPTRSPLTSEPPLVSGGCPSTSTHADVSAGAGRPVERACRRRGTVSPTGDT